MEKTCSNCGDPVGKYGAKGFCSKCYKRQQRHGDPSVSLIDRSRPPGTTCSECDEPVRARGYCLKHWRAWNRYGDPHFRARPAAPENCTECGDPTLGRGAKGLCGKCYQRNRKYGDASDAILQRHPRKGTMCTNCGDPVGSGSGRGYCDRCYKRWQVHGDPTIVLPPSPPPVNRIHTLNHEYFDDVSTPEQAYWLGFIAADGCVIKNGKSYVLSLGLAEKDAEHVRLFARSLGSSKEPQPSRRLCKGAYKTIIYVHLDSRYLVESLERIGIGPRKSATVEPWNGPADLMPHYWRGLFDGDGCIHRHKKKTGWTLTQVGSQACVTGFTRWAAGICGTRTTARHVVGGCWQMAVGGSWMPQALATALYRDSPVALPRKLALANELIAADFRHAKSGKRTLPRYG